MSIKYKYEVKDGDIEECDSCGSEAPLLEFPTGPPKREIRKLCKICASTFVGNKTEYRRGEQIGEIAIIIAQIANLLLDELTDRRKNLKN